MSLGALLQEYSEEFRDIGGRSRKGLIADGNIALINQRTISDDLPVRTRRRAAGPPALSAPRPDSP